MWFRGRVSEPVFKGGTYCMVFWGSRNNTPDEPFAFPCVLLAFINRKKELFTLMSSKIRGKTLQTGGLSIRTPRLADIPPAWAAPHHFSSLQPHRQPSPRQGHSFLLCSPPTPLSPLQYCSMPSFYCAEPGRNCTPRAAWLAAPDTAGYHRAGGREEQLSVMQNLFPLPCAAGHHFQHQGI